MKSTISVVIPAYNEEENIGPLLKEIKKVVPRDYDYEFIVVDDGSTDSTREKIEILASDSRVKGIFLYRNFGHQPALLAGLTFARGDAVIIMDADFQHPPELIPKMIQLWRDGHDLVVARKKENRVPSLSLRLLRCMGYMMYRLVGNRVLIPGVSDFRLMDSRIATFVKRCPEYRFVLRGLSMLPARSLAIIPYRVGERRAGKSGYSFSKLFSLFLYSVTSFSLVPLRFASILGAILVLSSFVYLSYILVVKFLIGKAIIEGWTALVSLLVILFGFLFFYLGVLGEYLGAVFDEVKRRPRFLIESTVNIDGRERQDEM